ncbi:MAG: phage tail tape measure protein [Leptospiraceae bacterium]|nr:phage tail tape measure protein [Leptospiraceae bacterium]
MAVNIGGIYFSVEADTKNAHLNIKNIQESVKTLADTGAAKLSNLTTAFKSLENASLTLSEKLARNTKFASNTFDGLNARVTKLQNLLNKSTFGSERFNNLNKALNETRTKLDTATQAASQSGSKLQGVLNSLGQAGFSSMSLLSAGIQGAAVALAGMVASKAFTLGVDFEKQMSEVGAATNATKAQFGELEKAARKLGATTSFSATQAAQAMTELGKAGLTTNQVLTGTNAVLNLAKAGQLGLAEAATIAADTMAGFGLQAEDMAMISDVLAKSANSSTIGVQELGETFKYVSGVAKGAGIDIQQIAAATSILGNAGIKGSMAGTALKSVILNLSAPSTEGAKALSKLGLSMSSLQDKQGNLKQLPEIFALLNDKASKFSTTQKADIFKDLFGMESLSGALALMDKAEMSFNAMTGKMESDFTKMVDVMTTQSKGFAKQYGDALSNNVSGQLDNLSSAVEEFFLVIYDPIKPIISVLLTWNNTLITMGTNLLKFILRPFKDLFDFLKPFAIETLKYFDSFGNSITDLSFLFDSLYSAIMEIPNAIFKTADAFDSMINEVIALFKPLTDAVSKFFDSFGESGSLWDSIIEGNKQIANAVKAAVGWFRENVTVLNIIKLSLLPLVVVINMIVASIRMAVVAWDLILKAIDSIYKRLQPLRDLVKTIVQGIKDLITGNISLNIDLPNMTESLKNAFDFVAIYNYFSKGFAEIWNDIKRMATQFWESFKTISRNAIDAIKDFFKNDKTLEKELEKKTPEIKAKVKVEKIEMPKPEKAGVSKGGTEKQSSNLDFGETFAEVNALSEKVKAFDEAISKTTGKLERLGLQVGKYAMIGQELIKSVGSRVLNLMGAQAQLASVKFDNLKQKLSFLSQASDKMIDDSLKNTINAINAETNLRLAEYENQLKALDDQKQAELQIEKDFQAEMKALKIQLDAESKAESERRFNEAWAVRQLEYERQLEFIAANTSDQTQLAISQQTLLNQQEQDKIALRQAIDQQLQDSLAVNQETIQAKEQTFAQQQLAAADAEAKKREAIEVKKTALLAEQENKRQQAQDRADQQKMQSQKAIRLFEWASGRAAFEMNKRQQAAQIQMQMASIVMSAIQAMAGFTAATLGFGVIAGMALAATITGLGLATGMTSLAAVNSAQYPPPPIFEKGGMVGGVSHSMGGTMIEAEAGEFVVNKNSAAANMDMLQAINSGKSMGGGTTIYYAGVQIGTIQTNNPDEIYNMVEPRIRQEIYQAVSR